MPILKLFSLYALCLVGFSNSWEFQQETKLKTGWYYITQNSDDVKRQLDNSNNVYFLDSIPITTSKNIKIISLKNDLKRGSCLEMRFDSLGTNAWKIATRKSVGRQLGFIFEDKLIQVPFVNSEIDFGLAVIWNSSIPELQLIKNSIESEK